MLKFLKQVGDYTKDVVQSAKYIGQGLSVTFDHMRRRPVTVQYPYEKLIPSERFRGRIHFVFPVKSAFGFAQLIYLSWTGNLIKRRRKKS